MLWLTIPAYAATPMAGLELAPFSRSDVVVVDDGRTTGRGVGEFDGTVWPNLRAFAGAWVGERVGLTGTLGVARSTVTSWADEVWVSRSVGVVRPSFDVRVSLLKRSDARPRPLLLVGAHVDVPTATVSGNGLSEDEQTQAELDAAEQRARLGGFGARIGAGVDFAVHDHVSIGFLWTARWHRSTYRSSELTSVSSWIGSEAAFTVAFEWPAKEPVSAPQE
ncbi:MAG: hypothetical protein AB8H79_03855 [Myxococcota bacterium]